MSDFIYTKCGTYIAASSIVRYQEVKGGGVLMVTADGGTFRSYSDAYGALDAKLPAAVIPAAPGHWALRYWPDENDPKEDCVTRWPVVAWRIVNGKASPVTNDLYDDECAVLTPEGLVCDETFSDPVSEEVWREHKRAFAPRRAKAKAEGEA